MMDRSARDRLAAAIEEFLSEDIGAFQFDDRIFALADETDDETVQEVALLLWFHYDDIKDHKAALSQVEWDYFQRLLLLLRSDASLTTDRHRRWTWRQPIALAAIVAFICGISLIGFGLQLLLITIPLGVVSMLLSRWPTEEAEPDPDDFFVRLTPYSSVAQMLAVHRRVPDFRKRRYPGAIKARRIRSSVANGLLWLPASVMWLVFSPVVLLVQAFPQTQSKSRVVPA